MAAGRNNKRRRRVILDEAVQGAGTNLQTESLPIETAKPYSAAARRRSQLKTTDLIPKRPVALAFVISSVVAIVVILNLLAVCFGDWQSLSESARHVFRFSGVGTLPNWFSSLLLMTTGMASLQIYGMRRHRCDDYNGDYQIWLFLAALFAIASVNCVVDFRAVLSELAKLAGFAGSNSFVIFLVAKMIALTALVVRGVLEIRASRAAFVAVVVVWIAYGCAIIAQIPGVQSQLVQRDEMVLGNLVMVGNVALLLAAVFYSRFVYLHANDLIAVELPRVASIASEVVDRADGSIENVASQPEPEAEDEESILKLDESSVGKSSRSARKRHKKAQRQQRRAA